MWGNQASRELGMLPGRREGSAICPTAVIHLPQHQPRSNELEPPQSPKHMDRSRQEAGQLARLPSAQHHVSPKIASVWGPQSPAGGVTIAMWRETVAAGPGETGNQKNRMCVCVGGGPITLPWPLCLLRCGLFGNSPQPQLPRSRADPFSGVLST